MADRSEWINWTADRLLVPERLATLLTEIIERRTIANVEVQDCTDQLSREANAAEQKLRRLYALVEDGISTTF